MKNVYNNINYYNKTPDVVVDYGVMSDKDKKDYKWFRDNILCKSQDELHKWVYDFVCDYYNRTYIHNDTSAYTFVEGKLPILLVAHMDTVHKTVPTKNTICVSDNGTIMTPYGIGGDDRCGIYIIAKLIMMGYKPSVLFVRDEEIGGLGTKAFVNSRFMKLKVWKKIKYMVEFDRKGDNDCVFYDNDNKDFIDYIESFGWVYDWGSYSDIADLGPATNIASVNLSSAYWEAHLNNTYINMVCLNKIVDRAVELIKDLPKAKFFKHVEKEYTYNKYYDYFGKDDKKSKYLDDDFYDDDDAVAREYGYIYDHEKKTYVKLKEYNDYEDIYDPEDDSDRIEPNGTRLYDTNYYGEDFSMYKTFKVMDKELDYDDKLGMRLDYINGNLYRCPHCGDAYNGYECYINNEGRLVCPRCLDVVVVEECCDGKLYEYEEVPTI